ncbi:MAG: cytochrome C, partial [Calditrichaeota bacterium]|nr:cytochrome C [Calditrichota bacterium]
NDHPVSFTYDAALASTDGGLYDPTSQTSGLGGTIDADMLYSSKLQCASCHDVHNNHSNGTSGHLLVKSNASSALCLTCHNK